MQYYFTGKKIAEVEYVRSIEESNGYDIKTVAFVYKNINTGETFLVYDGSELFYNKAELIKAKIDEFENEVNQLNDQILFLKSLSEV